MKKRTSQKSAFSISRLLACLLCLLGLFLALLAISGPLGTKSLAQGAGNTSGSSVWVGASYHNDVSPPLREMPAWSEYDLRRGGEREANENPKVPYRHIDSFDPVVQNWDASVFAGKGPYIPVPIRTFDGIPFPGVGCNCAPPDPNGAVGLTQYVQIVNEGYQVFDKATGNSVLSPRSISSIWSGFGGVCETGGSGDPVVLYDHLANRWLISQFAGASTITDECVAISTTSDATGSYYRYGFHLGSNFFDYPHLGVWPDAYYMSMNVFNSSGTTYLVLSPSPLIGRRCWLAKLLPLSVRWDRAVDRSIRFCPQILMGRGCRQRVLRTLSWDFPARPLIPITPPIISMLILLLLQTQRLLPLPVRPPLVSLRFVLRVVPVCRKMELLAQIISMVSEIV